MKTLPTSTHRHGAYYSLVRREGSIAMYSLRYTPCGANCGLRRWEGEDGARWADPWQTYPQL